jgi:hypothetical protein
MIPSTRGCSNQCRVFISTRRCYDEAVLVLFLYHTFRMLKHELGSSDEVEDLGFWILVG